MQPPAGPVPASRGLTPASAWLGPRVVAATATAPGSPDPFAYTTTENSNVSPSGRSVASVYTASVAPAEIRSEAASEPSSTPTEPAPVTDPMAPRRDAPIFRLQSQAQGSTPAATQGQASVQSGEAGARYYSVHRDAGRQPDPTALPDPVYFDSVTLDLAEPPATEGPGRDAQGGRRAPVANEDPSLP